MTAKRRLSTLSSPEIATAGVASSGSRNLFPRTDGHWYGIDKDGIETPVSAQPLLDTRPFAAFYASLTASETTATNIVFIGDSTLDGGANSSFENRTDRIFERRLRKMRNTGIGTGGSSYIPPFNIGFGPQPPATIVGTEGAGSGARWDKNSNFGLGRRAIALSGGGEVQYTKYCDRIKVWYSKAEFFSTFGDVYIDGVLVATGLSSQSGTGNGDVSGFSWDSGALIPGVHTIRVVGTGANGWSFFLDAVEFFENDYSKGIHVYGGAHYGASTDIFSDAGSTNTHWAVVGQLKPSLVVISLGINDLTNVSISETQYLTNIDTILSKLATAMGSTAYSVLLVVPYRVPDRVASYPAKWSAMVAGLKKRYGLVNSKSNVALLDMNDCWPYLAVDGSANNNLMAEATNPLHPNNAGADLFADILLRRIFPFVAPDNTVTVGTRVIDLGATPSASFTRTISWPGATVGQPIICTPSTDYPSSIRSDEYEMAPFVVAGMVSAADTIEVIVQSVLGAPIAGRVRVNISV